jgi:formate hydrogenlyase subunit 3/multisubunit Na+/H+ antiporter MnhD subunit
MPAVAYPCWSIVGFLAIGALAIALGRAAAATRVIYAGTLMVSMLALAFVASALLQGSVPASSMALPLGLPWIGVHFKLDALAAFFLVVVNLGGALASLYGLGYGRHDPAPHRVLPFFPAFLAAMNLVVLADDAFTFLFAWELMSVMSWALVMAHHRDPENRRAGYIYLLMASFGTLILLLAFGLLAGADGGYGFDAIRTAHPTPFVAGLGLLLVLLGTGSKAGLVPLHVWLPLAHPAAPSHVSALMSGVMTKIAIYAFIRIAFDLLGAAEWWSAVVVLLVGGVTMVMGILHAQLENDLKRLLAFSTIENVGLIFVSLGLALAFRANGMNAAAALAMTAALFHIFNHTSFKSLLFFGAGAVLTATGERDMGKLGGLIHRMPLTSFVFLVGCIAASALPPSNGFASEWLVFQAILQSPDLPQWGLKILVPAVGGLLALSAALVAASFVRAFGMTFLGRARTTAAAAAAEVDRFSAAGMLIPAGLCVLAGILPGFAIDGFSAAVQMLLGARMPVQANIPWLSVIPVAESHSSYNGLLVFLFVAGAASLAAFSIHRLASREVRRAPLWGCGFPELTAAMQYTAGSFAQPIVRVFGAVVFRAKEQVDMPRPGEVRPARYTLAAHDLIWENLYAPITDAVSFAASQLNRLQFLTIRRYLSLVFALLVLLLLALTLWP